MRSILDHVPVILTIRIVLIGLMFNPKKFSFSNGNLLDNCKEEGWIEAFLSAHNDQWDSCFNELDEYRKKAHLDKVATCKEQGEKVQKIK